MGLSWGFHGVVMELFTRLLMGLSWGCYAVLWDPGVGCMEMPVCWLYLGGRSPSDGNTSIFGHWGLQANFGKEPGTLSTEVNCTPVPMDPVFL